MAGWKVGARRGEAGRLAGEVARDAQKRRVNLISVEPGGRLKKSPSAATRIGPLKTPAAPPKKAYSMPGSCSAGTMWLSSR